MKPEYSQNANARIALEVIRHGVLLEQYKTYEVRKIIGFLNRYIEPDLVKKLQKYAGREWTQARLQALRAAVLEIMQDGYVTLRKTLQEDLFKQALTDTEAGVKIIEKALPLHISLVTPSVAAIRDMLNTAPIYGRFVPEWFEELAQTTARRVNQQIMIGVTEGEGIDGIVRRIVGTRANQYRDGILDRARSDAEAVVRTAVAGVSNNVRQEVYRTNGDIIKAIQWTATLDVRTCEACMNLDGQTWDLEEHPNPPLHYNCRCTMVPVLKSWKELGLPLQEAGAGTRASSALTKAENRRLRNLPPDERRALKARLQGQVPESLTYPQWLRRQSVEFQNEALGKRRADLFRSGRLEIKDFVDDHNRILTLEQLRAKLN